MNILRICNILQGMTVDMTLNYTVSATDKSFRDDAMIPSSLMGSCSGKPMYWMREGSSGQTSKLNVDNLDHKQWRL